MIKNEEGKGRNWKAKYLTIEQFERFMNNDFHHLKGEVREVKWVLRGALVVLIGWALIDRLLC